MEKSSTFFSKFGSSKPGLMEFYVLHFGNTYSITGNAIFRQYLISKRLFMRPKLLFLTALISTPFVLIAQYADSDSFKPQQ
jgi:hypothetical protein